MAQYTIFIAFILYLLTGWDCYRQKDYSHCLIWVAYAISQLGFIWHEWEKMNK